MKILVVHGPGLGLDRPGLTGPAPGSRERLEGWCERWAKHFAVTVTQRWAQSDAEVDAALAAPEEADAIVLAYGTHGPALRRAPDLPVVEVAQRTLAHPYPRPATGPACVRRVHGRGFVGYRAALAHLAAQRAWAPQVLRYGPLPEHVGDLRVPGGPGPHPVAVVVHGGFWWHAWDRDQMDWVAIDLARRGYATWNVEYRLVGATGGWPETALDAAAALDHVGTLPAALDLDRVVTVGHSAGGQLALWLASAARRRIVGPGRVAVARVLALAPVADLRAVHDRFPRGGSVGALLGPDAGERYADASPLDLVPLGVPQVVVHGTADEQVAVGDSRRYVEAAREAGDAVTSLELDEVDHWSLVDVTSEAWRCAAAALLA